MKPKPLFDKPDCAKTPIYITDLHIGDLFIVDSRIYARRRNNPISIGMVVDVDQATSIISIYWNDMKKTHAYAARSPDERIFDIKDWYYFPVC